MHSSNICRSQHLQEKGHLIRHVHLSLNFVSTTNNNNNNNTFNLEAPFKTPKVTLQSTTSTSTIVAVFVIVIISNYYYYYYNFFVISSII